MSLFLALLLQGTATPGIYTPSGDLPIPRPRGESTQVKPDLEAQRARECRDLATVDAEQAQDVAQIWLVNDGGINARQCLAFAYFTQGDWGQAEIAYAAAAQDAIVAKDARAASFSAQAGNAALLADDFAAALGHFDTALSQGTLAGEDLGQLHLDRARAFVALGRSDDARVAIDFAKTYAPQDAVVWLLSATLARRMDNLGLAQDDIIAAAALDPRNPDIGLEAGNIAISAGNADVARKSWTQVALVAPDSAAAAIARNYVAQLDILTPPTLGFEPVE